jgi:SAM-dependent methyltransferase
MVSALAARMQDDSAAAAVSGDATALPWPDAHFDWVGLHFMLYHVPDIAGALREADRVLQPGGVLSAATNGPLQYRELMALHRQAVAELGLPTVPDAGPLRFSLSNGPHFFPPHRTVQAEVHAGGFRFPAADPAAAYYESGFYRVGLDPAVAHAHKDELVAWLREHVADIIRRDGAFTVVSESGYFWYQKPVESA